MSGSYYIALSGLRARLDALDRVGSDIANSSTSGYKAERTTTAQADRPNFDGVLRTAIDVSGGTSRVDLRAGAITGTGRDLDVAIDGPGMFVLDTPAGPRYTRDGRFVRRADGALATAEGDAVQGVKGPIQLADGPVQIEPDGTVRSGGVVAGRLMVVEFNDPTKVAKESAYRFRADGTTTAPATHAEIRASALEQSNVSVVDRIAELTTVTRSFESLQKALSVMANDVDSRAISELGRRR